MSNNKNKKEAATEISLCSIIILDNLDKMMDDAKTKAARDKITRAANDVKSLLKRVKN